MKHLRVFPARAMRGRENRAAARSGSGEAGIALKWEFLALTGVHHATATGPGTAKIFGKRGFFPTVAILTNGYEYASHRYTQRDLAPRIRHRREKCGWEFLFLGANLNAIAAADLHRPLPKINAEEDRIERGQRMNPRFSEKF